MRARAHTSRFAPTKSEKNVGTKNMPYMNIRPSQPGISSRVSSRKPIVQDVSVKSLRIDVLWLTLIETCDESGDGEAQRHARAERAEVMAGVVRTPAQARHGFLLVTAS